jgi:protein-tyrosine phosphatase
VHCFAGVSRSATIVTAYLMQEMAMSYIDAT